jgi:hypothetical protein
MYLTSCNGIKYSIENWELLMKTTKLAAMRNNNPDGLLMQYTEILPTACGCGVFSRLHMRKGLCFIYGDF